MTLDDFQNWYDEQNPKTDHSEVSFIHFYNEFNSRILYKLQYLYKLFIQLRENVMREIVKCAVD